jgi:hypothetical protein
MGSWNTDNVAHLNSTYGTLPTPAEIAIAATIHTQSMGLLHSQKKNKVHRTKAQKFGEVHRTKARKFGEVHRTKARKFNEVHRTKARKFGEVHRTVKRLL